MYTEAISSKISIEASGCGGLAIPGEICYISIDGKPQPISLGLNVYTFDGWTGENRCFLNFRCDSESASDAFAKYVEELIDGYRVIVALQGEVILGPRAMSACRSIGSSVAHRINGSFGWAILGQKGAPPGSVLFETRPRDGKSPTLKEEWTFLEPTIDLTAHSPGGKETGFGGISINGQELFSPHDARYGSVYVAAFNTVGQLIERFIIQEHPDASFEFIDKFRKLPQSTIVAIAHDDRCPNWLTKKNSAYSAILSLGSRYISSIREGSGWAFIGTIGASTPIQEQFSGNGSVVSSHKLRCMHIERPLDIGITLSAPDAKQKGERKFSVQLDGIELHVGQLISSSLILVWFDLWSREKLSEFIVDLKDKKAGTAAFLQSVAQADESSVLIAAAGDSAVNTIFENEHLVGIWNSLGYDGFLTRGGAQVLVGTANDKISGFKACAGKKTLFTKLRLLPDAASPLNAFKIRAESDPKEGCAEIFLNQFPLFMTQELSTALLVSVIDKETGVLMAHECFANTPSESVRLEKFISGVAQGMVVAIAKRGQITNLALDCLHKIGCGWISANDDQAIAIVGIKGAPQGSIIQVSGQEEGAAAAVKIFPRIPADVGNMTIRLHAESMSFINDTNVGWANIGVNGNSALTHVPKGRGIYVAVFGSDGRWINARRFDTHENEIERDRLISFLDFIQEDEYVAIAIADEGVGRQRTNLQSNVSEAFKRIGSELADKLSFRDSWVLISRGNGQRLAEAQAPHGYGPARATALVIKPPPGYIDRHIIRVEPKEDKVMGTQISMDSSSLFESKSGIQALIWIDKRQMPLYSFSADSVGINKFVRLLERELGPGDIVCISATNLPLLSDGPVRSALCNGLAILGGQKIIDSFGSGSWGLVGVKGMPPGSAVEALGESGKSSCGMDIPTELYEYHTFPTSNNLVTIKNPSGFVWDTTIKAAKDGAVPMAAAEIASNVLGRLVVKQLAKSMLRGPLAALGPVGVAIGVAWAAYDVYTAYREVMKQPDTTTEGGGTKPGVATNTQITTLGKIPSIDTGTDCSNATEDKNKTCTDTDKPKKERKSKYIRVLLIYMSDSNDKSSLKRKCISEMIGLDSSLRKYFGSLMMRFNSVEEDAETITHLQVVSEPIFLWNSKTIGEKLEVASKAQIDPHIILLIYSGHGNVAGDGEYILGSPYRSQLTGKELIPPVKGSHLKEYINRCFTNPPDFLTPLPTYAEPAIPTIIIDSCYARNFTMKLAVTYPCYAGSDINSLATIFVTNDRSYTYSLTSVIANFINSQSMLVTNRDICAEIEEEFKKYKNISASEKSNPRETEVGQPKFDPDAFKSLEFPTGNKFWWMKEMKRKGKETPDLSVLSIFIELSLPNQKKTAPDLLNDPIRSNEKII